MSRVQKLLVLRLCGINFMYAKVFIEARTKPFMLATS